MSFEIPGNKVTVEASADLSLAQFRVMTIDANGQLIQALATGAIAGVLQNKPAVLGEAGEVMTDGISKVEAGKSELNMDEVDIGELITSAVELMRERANQGGLTMVVEVPPHLPIVVVDGRRVQQVLLNLISNAIKFTPEAGLRNPCPGA